MHRIIIMLALSALLWGCTTAPAGDNYVLPGTNAELERIAYERTGDVRIIYYVKRMMVPSAKDKGEMVEQAKQHHVLVNRSHTMRQGVPDHRLPPEERLMYDSDMHDLLVVWRDQLGFFNRGNAVNILGDDPIARADADRRVRRIMAVEQIIDGRVNTSYFARHEGDEDVNPSRTLAFRNCEAILLEAISKAIPRGTADDGRSAADALGRRR